MGADTITVQPHHLQAVRQQVASQATCDGLDINDPSVAKFVEHVAKTTAAHLAWQLLHNKQMHEITSQGHWAPGGCTHVHVPEDS